MKSLNQPPLPAKSVCRDGVDKFDSAGLIDVAESSMLKGSTLTSLKAPRITLRSNSCSVPGRRELLDWSGVVQEANDVLGGRRGVGRDLADPPVMIAGLVPEVGADGEDGSAEATRPILVRDEAVAQRQNSGALVS